MDGGQVLAPTPIVRITAEQLEYLINRIRAPSFTNAQKKLWTSRTQTVNLGAGASQIVLQKDTTRKLICFSALGGAMSLQPGNVATGNAVFTLAAGQTLQFPIDFETFGFIVTQQWTAFAVALGTISIIDIFGPPSLEQM